MKKDNAALANAALEQAVAAYGDGRLEQASKGFRRVLSLMPRHTVSLRMLGSIALRQKKLTEASSWLNQAVQAEPTDVDAWSELGRVQRAAADYHAALVSFEKALAIQPESTEALHEIARTKRELGAIGDAVAAYQSAISRTPGEIQLYLELADVLRRSGQSGVAAEVLLVAQKEFPNEAKIYAELGSVFAVLGNWEGAEICFSTRCSLQPDDALAQYNWGVSLQELGRIADALAAFERAIGINPSYASAYYALGLAYRQLGVLEAALMAFDLAMKTAPDDARFPLEQARVLLSMNNPSEALQVLDALLTKCPHFAEAVNVRGVALKSLHRGNEALAAYDSAVQLQPDFVDARVNRGNLRLLQRNFSAALADFDEVQRLKPDTEGLSGIRLYTGMHLYRWEDFNGTVTHLIKEIERGLPCVQPLAMECFVDDPAIQQKTARAWAGSVLRPEGGWQRAPGTRRSGKVRVAYVSTDFKSHPVSFLMAEVFELHDRERFELIAINYGAASNDSMQDRLRESFDHFYDVENLSDQRIAELARALDVDVAVDISGFTAGARTTLFAWRLAPVQILYVGYLGTSGSNFYDYVIADPVIVTPQTRPYYDEKVIFLPWYQANDRKRPSPSKHTSRAELGLPERGFVFCSFNNPSKLTPATFDTWVEILNRVPGSILWVLGEEDIAQENLRQNARDRGLDPSCLVFAKRSSRENYLANLATADLFLDTLPYNAGTTASDALWMGLPVLTLKGQSFAGRVAASVLSSAGLPDLIANGREEYIDLAVRLAQTPALIAQQRERISSSRKTCQLFDAPAFTRHLESAILRALALHEAGSSPIDIDVAQ